jgi:hypothetical protein
VQGGVILRRHNYFGSSAVETMNPKSPPPPRLDSFGKRRQMLKVQVLEREIGLLQVSFLFIYLLIFFQALFICIIDL